MGSEMCIRDRVENSEGAHNPDLTFETLDKAEAAADQALSMLG